mgnify:CR=1 FL=1
MMNVVNSGCSYQIYGEGVKVYNELPLGCYEVAFNKMTGFFLTSRSDLQIKEDKIYGSHLRKIEKVIRSFQITNRNLGVILSGPKGIGKSLFARLLANKGMEVNLPIIIIPTYYPGIANFLSSIEQEVIVIFDEFEKTFGKDNDGFDPQEEMLTLFDGMDAGKKLFVVTCNEAYKLNSFMINRPGRFHYHFTIKNPTDDEIIEYMTDNLKSEYHNIIPRIINLAKISEVTYDVLKALVFELNQGYSFEEIIEDLNFEHKSNITGSIYLLLEDNSVYQTESDNCQLNLNNKNCTCVYCHNVKDKNDFLQIKFYTSDLQFVNENLMLDGSKIDIINDEEDYWNMSQEEIKVELEKVHKKKIKNLTFVKQVPNPYANLLV